MVETALRIQVPMTDALFHKTILLVEDDAIVALDQERRITSFGYRVIKTYSGERAVETIRDNPQIDLVLMDIDLGGGIDGTDAARLILEIRKLPIVFLTSHSERAMVEKVKGITRYGYVLKTSGEFVLAESIEMALNLFDSHRRLEKENLQHRRTRKILAEKTVFLESTFEAIQDGISVLDADLNVRHVNSVMERWYRRRYLHGARLGFRSGSRPGRACWLVGSATPAGLRDNWQSAYRCHRNRVPQGQRPA
jgi:CheY-like chemotaxis protein